MTNPNERNLPVPRPNAQPALSNAAPAIDWSTIPVEIMARAASIAADVMAKGETINAAQALAAAYHFAETGEVMGRHSYVGTKGSVAGRVIEGYRGVTRRLDMSKFQWRYRAPTEQEIADHNLRSVDRMLVCELVVLSTRLAAMQQSLEYWPILGYSIVRQGDKLNSPAYRDSRWIMEKQALVDALRKVGENTTADEVLAEAEAAGVDMSNMRDAQIDGGHLDRAQAEIAVQKSVDKLAQAAMPAAERAEYEQELRNQMAQVDLQKRFGDWLYACAMGDETACPSCGTPYATKAHTNACAFRLVQPKLPLYVSDADTDTLFEMRTQAVRPASIEPIRQRLLTWAKEVSDSDQPATPRQLEWTALAFGALTEDMGAKVAVMAWAFDGDDDLTKGMAKAIYEWTQPEKDAVTKQIKLTGPALVEFPQVLAALLAASSEESSSPTEGDAPPEA